MTAWLEEQNSPLPKKLSCPDGIAVEAWNIMGGQVDFQALPIVLELLGVPDTQLEIVIHTVLAIRDHYRRQASAR